MESKLFPNEFEDLSSWEFVNSTDDDDFEDSLYNGFGYWSSLSATDDESEDKDLVIEIQQVVEVDPPIMEEDSAKAGSFNVVFVQEEYGDSEVDLDDEEEDEVDLDDELVPWGLNDRFGRGRMRKLGKRSYAKMTKSKRVAYTFNRPGCVHGKHGLGLKHSF